MTNSVGAVLLDTRSIQKYVFASNELKTNVGASYIVDRIFTDLMCKQVLKDLFYEDNLNIDWKNNKEFLMQKNSNLQCEVVYVGGGNMLLLVRMEDEDKTLAKCKEIVKAWSKTILLCAPGLHTGVAIGTIDLDNFKSSLAALYGKLKENQNNILPNVDLPYTGLTKECDVCGKTADAWDDSSENKKRMVASEVKAKIEAYRAADAELQDKYRKYLRDEYCFANEFERIGYKEGESYLSVIHIDGNNMGVKFSACDNAQERKVLSLDVQRNVETAFSSLLQHIVDNYDKYGTYLDMSRMEDKKSKKKILPIRPIIIGGDDVTFVCPGRLGIEYAKFFMEAMSELPLLTEEQHKKMEKALQESAGKDKKLSQGLSCCAGVAIVSAKYPFFRAYELAEQLCSAAKKNSRQEDTNWLDFAILHGEKTPELDQLRHQQYIGAKDHYLHYGPYRVDKKYEGKDGLEALLELEGLLSGRISLTEDGKEFLPMEARNKIKKLREVLTGNEHAINIFFENTNDLQKIIRHETGKTNVSAKDLWDTKLGDGREVKVTRYIDAIELMDFRPEEKER